MKYSAIILLALLAGCTKSPIEEGQLICTLKGEAFTVREGMDINLSFLRSPDADRLCEPLKQRVQVQ